MAYIDNQGNVCDKKQKGIIETITSIFAFIWMFFASLLGLESRTNSYQATSMDYRNQLRGNGGAAGGGGGGGATFRGGNGGAAGGGGGGGATFRGGNGGDGFRRNIGRLPDQSNIAAPPMGGGCCGGGGCG